MLSIIIPLHMRNEHLDSCINQLAPLEEDRFLVFFVLDGSPPIFKELIHSSGLQNRRILTGDGELYWGGAMNLGMREAFAAGSSAVLWLNDDTSFTTDDVRKIEKYHRLYPDLILGAQLKAINLDERAIYHRESTAQECTVEYLNGNFTLVPRSVYTAIGNINPRKFPHFADGPYFDSARRMGAQFCLVPGLEVGITYDVLRHLPIRWQYYLGTESLLGFLRNQLLRKNSKWYLPYRFHYSRNRGGGLIKGIVRFVFAAIRDFHFLIFPFGRNRFRHNPEVSIQRHLPELDEIAKKELLLEIGRKN